MTRSETRATTGRLVLLGRVLAVSCLACWFGGCLLYYWPNIPTSPHPEAGNIYPVQIHGGNLYFTRTLFRLRSALLIVAAVFAAGSLLLRLVLSRDKW